MILVGGEVHGIVLEASRFDVGASDRRGTTFGRESFATSERVIGELMLFVTHADSIIDLASPGSDFVNERLL